MSPTEIFSQLSLWIVNLYLLTSSASILTYICKCGFRKLLNTDPIRIRIPTLPRRILFRGSHVVQTRTTALHDDYIDSTISCCWPVRGHAMTCHDITQLYSASTVQRLHNQLLLAPRGPYQDLPWHNPALQYSTTTQRPLHICPGLSSGGRRFFARLQRFLPTSRM